MQAAVIKAVLTVWHCIRYVLLLQQLERNGCQPTLGTPDDETSVRYMLQEAAAKKQPEAHPIRVPIFTRSQFVSTRCCSITVCGGRCVTSSAQRALCCAAVSYPAPRVCRTGPNVAALSLPDRVLAEVPVLGFC